MNIAAVQTNPVAQASTTGANSTNGNNSDDNTESMFMTLLTTELKEQDPTSPFDPNQMVSQLTEFNILSQVTEINQSIQGISSQATSAAQAAGGN
ncbi:MAG TPA: flagellar hook capping FlgD N-terminal domain-containing protein [candidate division Zixibacteria bacterium]|nr:flagellar hook capping FlgD N-terminal domain-containing protein [candidate division Zixibacteria bacterium]